MKHRNGVWSQAYVYPVESFSSCVALNQTSTVYICAVWRILIRTKPLQAQIRNIISTDSNCKSFCFCSVMSVQNPALLVKSNPFTLTLTHNRKIPFLRHGCNKNQYMSTHRVYLNRFVWWLHCTFSVQYYSYVLYERKLGFRVFGTPTLHRSRARATIFLR